MKSKKILATLLAGVVTVGSLYLQPFKAKEMEGEILTPSECVTKSYTRIEETNYIPTNKDRAEIKKAMSSGYVSVPADPKEPIKALSEEDVADPMVSGSKIIEITNFHGKPYFKFLEIAGKSHNTSYKTIKGSRDTNPIVYCLNMEKRNPPDGHTMTPIGKARDNLLYIIRMGHPRGNKSGSPVAQHFYTASDGADWRFWNYYITQIAVWIEMGSLTRTDVSKSKVINKAPGSLGAYAGRFYVDALKYGPRTVDPEIYVNKQRIEAKQDKDPNQLSTPVGKTDGLYLGARNCATDELNDQGAGVKSFKMRVTNPPPGLRVLVKNKQTGKNTVYEWGKDTPHIFAADEFRFVFPKPSSSGEFRYTILGDCTVWRAYKYSGGSGFQQMLKEDLVAYGKEIKTEGSVFWTAEEPPEPEPPRPPEPPTQTEEYIIKAKKVDAQTGQALQGAKFALEYPDGALQIATTNSNGIAEWAPISENAIGNGRFKVTETQAPPGYTLPTNATQIVNLPPQNGTTVTITFRDEKEVTQSFELKAIKKDAADKRVLQGAEFKLTKPDGTSVTGTSNNEGVVVFSNLTATGRYVIEETRAPQGYELAANPRQEVNVTDVNNIPTTTFEFLNQKSQTPKYEINATKVDKGTKAPLAGAVFELTGPRNFRQEITTSDNGVISFTNLDAGTYTLTEKTPPQGYQLAANPTQQITLPGNNATGLIFENEKTTVTPPPEQKHSITVKKVDKEDNSALAGAVFEITGANGVKQERITGQDGKVKFDNLNAGTYTITEKTPPPGYELAENPTQQVTVPGQAADLVFKNQRKPETPKPERHSITATKVDKGTKAPLAGAVFELTGDTGFSKEATTGTDGTVKFDDLVAGTYTLTEKVPPQGYQLAANPSQQVTVPGNTQGLIFENEKIPDKPTPKPEKGSVELLKYDSTDNKHLAGVEFELFKKDGTSIGKYTTGENGKLLVTDLEPGDYYFIETKALEGYYNDKEKLEFTIPGEGGLIQLTKGNRPDNASVEITKTDVSTGEVLKGAHLKIYAEDKTTVLAEGDTDSAGKFSFGPLKPGKYYFQESGAPEGYVLDDTLFPFEIKPGGEIVKCTMTNKPEGGKVEITKTDVSTGEVIPGAHLKIYAEDKTTILAGGITDENGKFTFGPLKPGKYFFQESGAPLGYVLDDTLYPFEVKDDGEIVKCTMTNKPIEGTLEITKTDISDGKLLPNAHFVIYDENKNQVVKGVTDEKGIAKFQLGYGKYYYQEYDAPVGYQVDDTLFPFEIKSNNEIVKCRMTNVPKPVPMLPTTGSAIATGGGVIAAIGAVVSALIKRWM